MHTFTCKKCNISETKETEPLFALKHLFSHYVVYYCEKCKLRTAHDFREATEEEEEVWEILNLY